MSLKDFREVSATAIVTAFVVVGAFLARPGATVGPQIQAQPNQSFAKVGACRIYATLPASDSEKLMPTVHITNPTQTKQTATFEIVVACRTISRPAYGMDRVYSPADYKEQTIYSQPIRVSLKRGAHRDIEINYNDPFALPPSSSQGAVYVVNAVSRGISTRLATFPNS